MTQGEIKVTVLIAQDGYKLTQAFDVAIQNRVISEKVFLAITDDASNWKEITNEEAVAIQTEQEEIAKKLLEND